MMKNTIAAISTPYGEGGVGIIRISGDNAEEILRKIFVPAVPGDPVNRRMTYGHIVDEEQNIVDEVLCVLMKKPKTYTAEDVVEINCHGGMVPLRKTLELVLRSGARSAERGEFTQRAFLGGRGADGGNTEPENPDAPEYAAGCARGPDSEYRLSG